MERETINSTLRIYLDSDLMARATHDSFLCFVRRQAGYMISGLAYEWRNVPLHRRLGGAEYMPACLLAKRAKRSRAATLDLFREAEFVCVSVEIG